VFEPCADDPEHPLGHSGAGDTAIWTGHLLAAERSAGRARRTRQSVRVPFCAPSWLLGGIERLFAVTGVRGLMCRAALPRSLALVTEDFFLDTQPDDYYRDVTLPGEREPWIGKGRAVSPPTRDSHVGVVLGLGMAYHLLADANIRARTGRLLTDLLDFLLRNGWNVPTPPQNKIRTTFIHQFHQQLAFLRVGATVDPGRFGRAYRAAAGAADASLVSDLGRLARPDPQVLQV
jgi:hypothetical protein